MPANMINRFPSIQEMTDQLKNNAEKSERTDHSGLSFEQVLRRRTENSEGLKFSKHASSRMETRNIDLSEDQWERLENGVSKAGEKGIRESLVVVDDLAFIVNVNSSTVITAVGDADEKIFTNIDGAVIA